MKALFLGALAFLLLFSCALAPPGGHQKLKRLREEVRPSPPKSSRSPRKREIHKGDKKNEPLEELWAKFALYITLSPFYFPHIILVDDLDRPASFPRYPYLENLTNGYMVPQPASDSSDLAPWALRLSMENGNDWDGMNRANTSFLLSTSSRFGVSGHFNYLNEELPDETTDDLLLGDCNLFVRFAQSEYAQFRAGIGVNFLRDELGTESGLNLLYGMDLMPAKPIILSTQFDVGALGGASLFHGRATVGWIFNRWELYAGFDYRQIGNVDIYGPLVGIRLWF